MKKSRKLAWVVLGVVGALNTCFFAWLSTSYSPWRPVRYSHHLHQVPQNQSPAMHEFLRSYGGPNNYFGPILVRTRTQAFPWLPGQDLVEERITPEEYEELTRRSSQ